MIIENIKISELKPYENNPRQKAAVDKVAASIKEFGFRQPIVVDPGMVVIVGHTRLQAAIKLGLSEVPVHIAEGLTESQARAYRLADNRTNEDAEWDLNLLQLEFAELEADGFDLSLTGFEEDELKRLEVEAIEPEGDPDEAPEPPSEPTTQPGDLYEIGPHRLLCGDSTILQAVEKLLRGMRVDIVFADPPYGISEKTDRSERRTGKCKGNKFDKIIGDDSIDTAVNAYFIADSLASIVCYWGGNYYAHKLPPSACWLVWDKRVEETQRNTNSDCELAYVKHPSKKSVRIFRHLWKGMMKASENGQRRVHPTQKPVALAEWAFAEIAPDSESVLDLFGGSGSTMVAAHQTGRVAFLMEIDPRYCDVIVARMRKLWPDLPIKRNGEVIDGKA